MVMSLPLQSAACLGKVRQLCVGACMFSTTLLCQTNPHGRGRLALAVMTLAFIYACGFGVFFCVFNDYFVLGRIKHLDTDLYQ